MMNWWKQFPIYQIYPRSFKDASGDGVGDLRGIIEKIDYFEWLGIKTLWLSPIYQSPMKDFGYDISDYRDIDPLFGSLDDFKDLLDTAHKKGMRLLMDFVPNHTSDQHIWFQHSKAAKDPYTDFYVWRDGIVDPETKERRPPNSATSVFGGPAWTWSDERQQYYLHHFLAEQPNLNYRTPQVRHEMKQILKFWVDLGVDGFRVDAVAYLGKNEEHADNVPSTETEAKMQSAEKADTFQVRSLSNACYEVVGEWVQFLKETYETQTEETPKNGPIDGHRPRHIFLCTECYSDSESILRYYDYGVDFPFNFSLINWTKTSTAKDLRRWIRDWMTNMPHPENYRPRKRKRYPRRAPDTEAIKRRWPNWVAGNHDQSRPASRLGGSEYANVINTLLLTLPGTATLYQGDELGMLDVPVTFEQCQDPAGKWYGPENYAQHTRDPCRSPLIWDADKKNGGFTTGNEDVEPWLPLSSDKALYAIDHQQSDPNSYLNLFRRVLRLRETEPVFYEYGHNIRLLSEGDQNFLVYERWAPEGGPKSDYAVILNIAQDAENKLLTLDLSEEIDVPDLSASIVVSSCTSDERRYVEGKEIDLTNVKMKPTEVLIVRIGDEPVDAKHSKLE